MFMSLVSDQEVDKYEDSAIPGLKNKMRSDDAKDVNKALKENSAPSLTFCFAIVDGVTKRAGKHIKSEEMVDTLNEMIGGSVGSKELGKYFNETLDEL